MIFEQTVARDEMERAGTRVYLTKEKSVPEAAVAYQETLSASSVGKMGWK